MDTKAKSLLKTEAEKWVVDGIISQEQCEQIQMRYPDSKESNPLLILFAIIGSLLIGAGIILVFATNWWSLPIALRVTLAFLPLLLAQGVCLYTLKYKSSSAPFREGSAVFLCLTFFAALALVSQIFHISGSMDSYLLVCIIFSLPAAYLLRSRGAIAIYSIGSLFVIGSYHTWVAVLLLAVSLPFFYLETTKAVHRKGVNFLLLLLSLMSTGTLLVSGLTEQMDIPEIALNCALVLLVIDALFRRVGRTYFFTSAKLLAIVCTTVTLLILQLDMSYTYDISIEGIVLAAVFAVLYLVLRRGVTMPLTASDLFFGSAVLLMVTAPFAGFAACLVALGLGVFYIVQGSQALVLSNINFGMTIVMLLIITRFFDSDMGLLARGIASIMLGIAFLGVNLYISRKRKELSK